MRGDVVNLNFKVFSKQRSGLIVKCLEIPQYAYSKLYGSLTIAVNYYHVAETENQEWTILFQYIDLKVAILNLRKICLYHKFN
jgi:hypothetical protein